MNKEIVKQFREGKISLFDVYEKCKSDNEFYEFLAQEAKSHDSQHRKRMK